MEAVFEFVSEAGLEEGLFGSRAGRRAAPAMGWKGHHRPWRHWAYLAVRCCVNLDYVTEPPERRPSRSRRSLLPDGARSDFPEHFP